MKKIVLIMVLAGLISPAVCAAEKTQDKQDNKPAVVSAPKEQFKARRKQIKQLIKKYKKAPESQKPAVKEELSQLVSQHVDAQMAYMKNRISQERANLDNWEKKIKEDEKDLAAVKAQRVEDLLSGEAEKKQKAARKAWKKQMRAVRK